MTTCANVLPCMLYIVENAKYLNPATYVKLLVLPQGQEKGDSVPVLHPFLLFRSPERSFQSSGETLKKKNCFVLFVFFYFFYVSTLKLIDVIEPDTVADYMLKTLSFTKSLNESTINFNVIKKELFL